VENRRGEAGELAVASAVNSRQDSAPAPGAGSAASAAPVLSVEHLTKAFGQTQALRDCTLSVHAGEVHTVVGENGSGKSTLVKILAGVHRPDAGTVAIEGRRLDGVRSPRAMIDAGVLAVFQEVLVVGSQTVLENVWLGSDGLLVRRVPEARKRERAEEVLRELFGKAPPLDAPAELLPLSVRQGCGIARALVRDPQILILDESTSALDVATRDRLFAIIRRRVAQGRSVIFISHRMDEIEEIADRITVLRSGRSVATRERGGATTQELVRLMSGAEHLTDGGEPEVVPERRGPGTKLLEDHDVVLAEGAEPIEFSLAAGDLIGLAGLEGHGQDDFLRALGKGSPGEVLVLRDGVPTTVRSARQARDLGMVYVPRDRRSESLFPTLSIRDNFAASSLSPDRRWGLLRRSRTDRRLGHYREQLAIKLASPGSLITTLSGGNQQKVVMARWLAVKPKILLLNDPTRGVDLNAKRDLYKLLRELAAEGIAVVMLSTELDELIELMDRVLVFREGSVVAELNREGLTREGLVAGFFGRGSDGD
jgi:ABC-type sugar transport system ATPase subunit